jgi:hypothetical protein
MSKLKAKIGEAKMDEVKIDEVKIDEVKIDEVKIGEAKIGEAKLDGTTMDKDEPFRSGRFLPGKNCLLRQEPSRATLFRDLAEPVHLKSAFGCFPPQQTRLRT